MDNKQLDKKYHGGRDNILGNDYEANFVVQKIVEMLMAPETEEEFITSVKRGKRGTNVDDVCIKTNKNKGFFYQCRKYARYTKGLYKPFLDEYASGKSLELALVTQNKKGHVAEVISLAKSHNFSSFKSQLDDDSQRKEQKKEPIEFKLAAFV